MGKILSAAAFDQKKGGAVECDDVLACPKTGQPPVEFVLDFRFGNHCEYVFGLCEIIGGRCIESVLKKVNAVLML
jgi:hypothetical protein